MHQYWNNFHSRQTPRIPASCPQGAIRYTVVPGDSFYRIAQRFGITVNQLISANPHIPNPNILIVGDVLCIPGQAPVGCPPGTTPYIVQPGDTLNGIAQRFGVSLEALLAANPQITNPNLIFPGDRLCIPASDQPQLPCCIYLAIPEIDARGSALFEPFRSLGQFSVSFLTVDLPPADEFGDYNTYLAEIVIPTIDNYQTVLFPVSGEPSLLAGREIFTLPDGIIDLPSETQLFIRPYNSATGSKGPVLLRGSLSQCANR